jgi:hypothetical protein
VLVTGLSGAIVVWQVLLSLSIYAFVEAHDTPGGSGTPVGILRDVAATIRAHAASWSDGQAIVYCPGDDPLVDEYPAVFRFLVGSDVDLRLVDRETALLFPHRTADTLVVLAPGDSRAAEALTAHAEELGGDTVWLRERNGAYRFYRLAAGTVPSATISPPGTPVRLENGVRLLGYDLHPSPKPGQTAHLTLYWHVASVPHDAPEQGYRFANHVLAANGERVGQHDGPGYPVALWRTGDTLASWFDLPVAPDATPGPYVLRTGMYVYMPPDQFVSVQVLNPEGGATAPVVEWALQ